MTDPNIILITSCSSLAGAAVVSAAFLKGWRGWLEIRRLELTGSGPAALPGPAGARIELADLKERVRRLEAIANGVE